MKSEKRYVAREEAGLFDRFDRLSQIDRMGAPLANLDAVMSWEIFQPVGKGMRGVGGGVRWAGEKATSSNQESSSNIHHKFLAIRHVDCCFRDLMKLRHLPMLLFPLAAANADTFGSGANSFTVDFVTIGDVGNDDDDTGFGRVDYTYLMGVHEVSESMIESYNALSGGPMITLDSRGANRPATSVSWNEAARFVNWLNTSSGYSAAYQFDTTGRNDNIALWEVGDAGYDAANPFRNANAHYFLPSEDEWYKAAYYDPAANGGAGGYWDYATGSDSAPNAVAGGTASGTAVYGQAFATGPADITNAGGLSAYGTMAQSGNVIEWGESAFDQGNNLSGEPRVARGGNWGQFAFNLSSSSRVSTGPALEASTFGFRVAAIPEPSAFLLTLIGMMGVVMRRRRPDHL